MSRRLTIGSRGSQLALWQTNWVKGQLESRHAGLEVAVEIISTKGDRVLDVSLPQLGEQGKGLFTAELEEAILSHRVDLAVHSLKDLPTELNAGLQIGAVSEREDVRDAFVARAGIASLDSLPRSAVLGTSSLRRLAQIKALRPDLEIRPVRGNVDTRLRKLDAGDYDALILAAAGLRRLGLAERITEYLDPEVVLPAVGQGALGIETREADARVLELLEPLNHPVTRLACEAERALLRGLGGGCLVPIAALSRVDNGQLSLIGLVSSPDGSEMVRGHREGSTADAIQIGERLAQDLISRGAAAILRGSTTTAKKQ